MNRTIRLFGLALLLIASQTFAQAWFTPDAVHILSWNISDDAFEAEAEEFQALLRWANPAIVLLDEVSPHADIDKLREALNQLDRTEGQSWHVSVGNSGGRQRTVIASLAPHASAQELASIVPYPDTVRETILTQMPAKDRRNRDYSMDHGIPVNAAIIELDERRLLVVIADLQCCGDGPDSWQEYRRQAEANEIRQRVNQVLQRTTVDAVIIAGDFNVVNGPAPLDILSGPYEGHGNLDPALMSHGNSEKTWTWDGRGTPFPSGVLDYQFYSPHSLDQAFGVVLDTEDIAAEDLEKAGVKEHHSRRTGRHRPLLGVYEWKESNDE